VLKRSVQQEAELAVADRPDFDPLNLDEHDKPFLIDGKVLVANTSLVVDTLSLGGVPFTISNDDQVGPLIVESDRSVAGILGANLFRKLAVLFDFDKRELTIVTGGNLDAKKRAELGFSKKDSHVDLAPFVRMHPEGLECTRRPGRCNGKDITLALNTGAAVTILQVPARDVGVKLPDTADSTLSGLSAGEARSVRRCRYR
jgi:hypothetical protein